MTSSNVHRSTRPLSEIAQDMRRCLSAIVGPGAEAHRWLDELEMRAIHAEAMADSLERAVDRLEDVGVRREEENRALREAIVEHRDAIRTAGEVRVIDVARALAATAKYSIDLDLWAVVEGQEHARG